MTLRSLRTHRATTTMAGIAATALTLSACGTDQAGQNSGDEKINVVASTSVWGSVAQAVGGESIEVESIIESAESDPHSYESTPRDAATVSDADLVVFNGGGYDSFIEQIMSGSGQHTPSVEAVQAGGHESGSGNEGGAAHEGEAGHGSHEGAGHEGSGHGSHEGSGHEGAGHEGSGHEEGGGHAGHDHSVNEHVWYDLHVVHETADRIADELAELRPAEAQRFHDSAARFSERVGTLEGRVEQIAAEHRDAPVIVTEPIAHYLIEQAGLRDVTPQGFVRSVESGNDPAAADVARIQDAVKSGKASVVVYNPQTESPVTEQVRETAKRNGIPVVEMTETVPPETDYTRWMDSQVTALENALNRKP